MRTSNGGFTYLGVHNYGVVEKKMEHLACFAGGMYAIGAEGAPTDQMKNRYMTLGTEIARTCRQSYKTTGKPISGHSLLFSHLGRIKRKTLKIFLSLINQIQNLKYRNHDEIL